MLVDRLRSAPLCEACAGDGGWVRSVPFSGQPRVRVECTRCAGTGSPLRARVELAAYCGDLAARSVVLFCRPRGTWFDRARWWVRYVLERNPEATTPQAKRSLLKRECCLEQHATGKKAWGRAVLEACGPARRRKPPRPGLEVGDPVEQEPLFGSP